MTQRFDPREESAAADAVAAAQTSATDALAAPEADSAAPDKSNVLRLPQRTYPVAVVARRLGIASATLRTWARRHGLTASAVTAGGHRRYTDLDIMRLQRVQQLYAAGSALDAASAVALSETAEQLQAAIAAGSASFIGGGNTTSIKSKEAAALREFLISAIALNTASCKRLLERAIRTSGIVGAWDDMIVPALTEIGSRWESTGGGVEVEHLASSVIAEALSQHSQVHGAVINDRPILLACTPNELHSLPLLAIQSALAERQMEARVLGARVPTDALVNAVEKVGPAVVVVWAQLEENADLDFLRAIPAMRPPVAVIPAGPGWPTHVFPESRRAGSLTHTVLQVKQALYL